jgi:hypothetical protein
MRELLRSGQQVFSVAATNSSAAHIQRWSEPFLVAFRRTVFVAVMSSTTARFIGQPIKRIEGRGCTANWKK